MLTQDQLNRLKRIVESYHILFAVKVMGADILTEEDKDLLKEFDIDIDGQDHWETAYKFGILSTRLRNLENATHKQVNKQIADLAITTGQKEDLRILRVRSFSHIKKLGQNVSHKVFDEFQTRGNYERLLRTELSKVARGEQWYQGAILNIGNQTGDWERDLKRLVETEMHDVQQEGRAAGFGNDALVYKHVFPLACKWCVKLFHTRGLSSEPKVFKVSELRANGNNYGLKPPQWKPIIGAVHPFCRCNLREYRPNRIWDSKKRVYAGVKKKVDLGIRIVT